MKRAIAFALFVLLLQATTSAQRSGRLFPFFASGLAVDGAAAGHPPGTAAERIVRQAQYSAARLDVGANVNLIGDFDGIAEEFVNGVMTDECSPGKQTAQNEFSIAINPRNPSNIVVGANDYRVYNATSNRYDASGGFYRSTDGGLTWTAGLLPGLVEGNTDAPGPYQAAGDPALSAGPRNVFWYANIAFNRTDEANSIAVSRSTDGGANWTTNYVVQLSAQEGMEQFNDKCWMAAHPRRSTIAYVTWTQINFGGDGTAPIVYSATQDGGRTWTTPRRVSNQTLNQGSVGHVDERGRLHLMWVNYDRQGRTAIFYASKRNRARSFGSPIKVADIQILPGHLRWARFRTPTLPGFARDGNRLHIVWNEWNGRDSDILYAKSADNGRTWSSPVVVDGRRSDQFFPWVAARQGKVYIAYLDHSGLSGASYNASIIASEDNGATWTVPRRISSKRSRPAKGNKFRYPDCEQFIGDYIGIAVGADGIAHAVWPDVRFGNSGPGRADHDPFTATVKLTTETQRGLSPATQF